MTRLQAWTLAGAAVIAVGVLECAAPAQRQKAPAPTHDVCVNTRTGHKVKCKGTVILP